MRLSPGSLYAASCLAWVAACSGSPGSSPDTNGDASAGAADDLTPPAVGALGFEPAGPHRATIAWSTDEPARSVLELGHGSATQPTVFDRVLDVSAEPATQHSIALDDLAYGVEYHARARCTDAAGNSVLSEEIFFAVSDRFAPVLTGLAVEQDTGDSLVVTWGTDEPATSVVEYGAAPELGTSVASDALTVSHEVTLPALAPGPLFFRVSSADAGGNAASSASQATVVEDRVAPSLADLVAAPVFPDAMRVSWRTDEPATAIVRYGEDPTYGQSVGAKHLAEEHAILLEGLVPGQSYHFDVAATDEAGNSASSGDGTFTLQDKVPPVLSSVAVTDELPHQVTVRWETDEPATARVEWGTTTAYGSVAEDVSAFDTEHEMTLQGLDSGTSYHFRVSSRDPEGNVAVGPDATFGVPDVFPPEITGVQAFVLAPGLAVVFWRTDEPASSVVFYGPTPSYGSIAVGVPQLVEEHLVVLTGLAVGATYHYRVSSSDGAGNTAQGDDEQLSVTDDVPPVVTGLAATQLSQDTALVQWTTDEPAIYLLQYGEAGSLDKAQFEADSYSVNHSAVIGGLDPGVWQLQVTAADIVGNLAVTPNHSFAMADITAPELGPVTAQADSDSITIRWQTDEPAFSRVVYGPTVHYGELTFGPVALETDHVIRISDVASDTTYHFSAISTDVWGNEANSPSSTVTTEEEPDDVEIEGDLVAWHPVQLTAAGPVAHELDDSPNPFLDYRFTVRFTGPSGQVYDVPGFFDGDGEGGPAGDAWRARFSPDEGGEWEYELFFHEGDDIAVNLNLSAGSPLAPHGTTGDFWVAGVDPDAEGFLRWGALEYVGGHYLKFRDGPYFLKGGTDSPENLLAYRGIDNTVDQGGVATGLSGGVHRYEPHFPDWNSGDPWFVSEDTSFNSKGIIGALNYLAEHHVNAVYFLPMNLGGDGREVCPFVGFGNNHFDKTHYDLSKLSQWNEIFEHATRRGIQLQFVLAETESGNENWLDNGGFGVQRKLFFRELVARFGHNLAIKWNLSEENDFNQVHLESFAAYLSDLDPFDHPIAFHTHMLGSGGWFGDYEDILGDERFTATSLQVMPDPVGQIVEKWRADSAASGHPWVIDVDEIGPASVGLSATNASGLRRRSLYDVYFSGGNIEWYMGFTGFPPGGDLNVEDFRTRQEMWEYMWYARKLLEELPFWEMEPRDELVVGEGQNNGAAEVFAKAGQVYAVYLPDSTATGAINLNETPQVPFQRRWYNPRTGEFVGSPEQVEGDQWIDNGPAPSSGSGLDWVLLYERL